MKVMYIRTSAADQCIDRQTELAKQLGITKLFIDKGCSGSNAERKELKNCLAFLRESDTLYVESISRLARNVRDLLNITEDLKKKGVNFVSYKENIDTTTPAGEFMLQVFGALYALELNNIKDRQKEGIAAARKFHPEKYAGRKKIEVDKDRFIEMVKEIDNGNMTVRALCKELSISPQTYYRRRQEYNL